MKTRYLIVCAGECTCGADADTPGGLHHETCLKNPKARITQRETEHTVMQIDGIPNTITRTKYVALIAELGLDTRHLVSLEFGLDVIRAVICATDENGREIIDTSKNEIAKHTITIPVID